MIVCICNDISERKIKKTVIEHEEIHTIKDLQEYLPVCTNCQGCRTYLDTIIQQVDGGRTK